MNNADLIAALRWCPSHGCGRCVALDANGRCTAHGVVGLMRSAADLIEAQQARIAELEAQMPKMCEFKSFADKIPNARNRYCTQCGAYFSDEEFENHTIRYCYYCGSKVKGEHDGET